ncbi:MAG TPA: type II toxin-antitoxin system PrlF family antitoxin [Longimicrobium sp.]|nr:type II toxin-antitoxin system PrlF family antitoxin [Longimicrobium sp.]
MSDAALEAILSFIDREMREHPEQVRPLSAHPLARAEEPVGDVEVDLDERLDDEVTLP